MVRTQVQLPNELYARAKRFAGAHEITLAELVRRGVERLLDQYPPPESVPQHWELPSVDAGGIRVPLRQLRARAAEQEGGRSLPHRRR
jgi:hypothetical protein